MVEIRNATAADIPAIVELGKLLHAESPRYSHLQFSAAKCEQTLRALMGDELARGVVLVAEENGPRGTFVVGMLVGYVLEFFFGHEKTAADLTLYLKPEARRGTTAARMVRVFEETARKMGAVDVSLGVSTEIHADRTAELYERLGYRRTGHSMLKELH